MAFAGRKLNYSGYVALKDASEISLIPIVH